MHTNSPCLPYMYLSFPNLNNGQAHPHSESITSSQLVDSQRSIKPSFSTTKVKLFTTVVHNKQRTQLASKFTATNGYLMRQTPLYFARSTSMLNHTQGCFLHAALAIRTIIGNLRNVESIDSLDIFSLRMYWRSLCGHISRQIHYGTNRVV